MPLTAPEFGAASASMPIIFAGEDRSPLAVTQKMIEDFKALDLFEPKEMNFQGNNPDGTPAPRQKIADYFAVSEDKLKALPEAKLAEFAKNGYLARPSAITIGRAGRQGPARRDLL